MRTLLLALLAAGLVASAQDTYKVRLRPVPIDPALGRSIQGSGTATATLAAGKLTVNGTFTGMLSPATTAKIHQGSKMGVRGDAVLDLTVAKAAAGAISGTVNLTPAQVDALKAGRLYIQIAAEKAPDGNLWGWFTK